MKNAVAVRQNYRMSLKKSSSHHLLLNSIINLYDNTVCGRFLQRRSHLLLTITVCIFSNPILSSDGECKQKVNVKRDDICLIITGNVLSVYAFVPSPKFSDSAIINQINYLSYWKMLFEKAFDLKYFLYYFIDYLYKTTPSAESEMTVERLQYQVSSNLD